MHILSLSCSFYPIPLLHDIVQAMSFSKMNVLHLHFADFPAYRIESLLHPTLTARLGVQSYTQSDVRDLVESVENILTQNRRRWDCVILLAVSETYG
jgi:hexosaminidase